MRQQIWPSTPSRAEWYLARSPFRGLLLKLLPLHFIRHLQEREETKSSGIEPDLSIFNAIYNEAPVPLLLLICSGLFGRACLTHREIIDFRPGPSTTTIALISLKALAPQSSMFSHIFPNYNSCTSLPELKTFHIFPIILAMHACLGNLEQGGTLVRDNPSSSGR